MEDRAVDILVIVAIIAVIILKICNVITISWLWLLCPIWGGLALGTMLAIVILILFTLECYLEKRR